MRNTKVYSITMPPDMAKQAERLAKKESRTMSELMREAFRWYQRSASAIDMREYVRMIAPPDPAIRAVREEAKRKGTDKLTMRQIDQEIKASRRERARKTTNDTGK